MKCPYCGKEMEAGLLQSARWIFFGKEKHKAFYLPKEGVDRVVAVDRPTGAWTESFYCEDCEMLITPLKGIPASRKDAEYWLRYEGAERDKSCLAEPDKEESEEK